ncbi:MULTISPECIES: mechanosensitive ion channel family protein [unclassified Winogradskyella]|uniref:mechanosensitive ion channel family protein n=1 Tax=unclassified Winogradskyella TaxID=2615021 RepID=UPI001E2AEC3C|nr:MULTISPECIES: mechanosensitive ion channel domain-containing protein [unclassified Winogradskyella]
MVKILMVAFNLLLSLTSIWDSIKSILDFVLYHNDEKTVTITVGFTLFIIGLLVLARLALIFLKRIVTRKLKAEDKLKFVSVFLFARWVIYVIILLIAFDSIGVNVTAIFAASAALLVGVGLALQTFFQDVISGIFILIDQSINVGDIVEIDGKVGRVEEIKIRTTRAVTIDNKVLVIPNHKYLSSILYNWTENGSLTRENIDIGVAYGSDVKLVKSLLLEVAKNHESILDYPEPLVLFTDFGDSALKFKLIFTLNDSFIAAIPKSDLRFEIDKVFRENNISIPFPQRDIHIKQNNK